MMIEQLPLSTSVTEERLAAAEVRLYQAKVEAILGVRYDADEFDRIVEEYRTAKRHADAARIAARQAMASFSKPGRTDSAHVASVAA